MGLIMKTISKNKNSENLESKSSGPFFNLEHQSGLFDQSTATPFFNVQPKLSINQPDDQYELEADAMADKVVSGEKIGNTCYQGTRHSNEM